MRSFVWVLLILNMFGSDISLRTTKVLFPSSWIVKSCSRSSSSPRRHIYRVWLCNRNITFFYHHISSLNNKIASQSLPATLHLHLSLLRTSRQYKHPVSPGHFITIGERNRRSTSYLLTSAIPFSWLAMITKEMWPKWEARYSSRCYATGINCSQVLLNRGYKRSGKPIEGHRANLAKNLPSCQSSPINASPVPRRQISCSSALRSVRNYV